MPYRKRPRWIACQSALLGAQPQPHLLLPTSWELVCRFRACRIDIENVEPCFTSDWVVMTAAKCQQKSCVHHQGAFGSARVCPGWKWTSYLDPVTSARLIACLIACLAVCLAACRTRLAARLLGAAAWRQKVVHIIGPISPALPFRPDRRALEAAWQVRPHRSPPALSKARGQRSAGSAARVVPCGYKTQEKTFKRSVGTRTKPTNN